uniref:PRISE-like Rossmann-fold domain-containing protein n=1 Tax=Oryza glumipatula TaxID=40148 RepID=A0A0E0AMA3_9ORYZ
MLPMSMSWWWAGAIGAARKRHDGGGGEQQPPFRSVALVVGSTGIVGTSLVDILPLPDTPGGPWKVYALSRRPPPPWSPPPPAAVTHLCVDLADAAAVAEALAPLTDITHVFYVALAAPHLAEARSREANAGMLRNVLAAVVPTCPALAHVALQTGSKHYIGPPESIGKLAVETPFSEDMPRHDYPNFYYDQEDVLFDAVTSSSSSSSRRAAAVTCSGLGNSGTAACGTSGFGSSGTTGCGGSSCLGNSGTTAGCGGSSCLGNSGTTGCGGSSCLGSSGTAGCGGYSSSSHRAALLMELHESSSSAARKRTEEDMAFLLETMLVGELHSIGCSTCFDV